MAQEDSYHQRQLQSLGQVSSAEGSLPGSACSKYSPCPAVSHWHGKFCLPNICFSHLPVHCLPFPWSLRPLFPFLAQDGIYASTARLCPWTSYLSGYHINEIKYLKNTISYIILINIGFSKMNYLGSKLHSLLLCQDLEEIFEIPVHHLDVCFTSCQTSGYSNIPR